MNENQLKYLALMSWLSRARALELVGLHGADAEETVGEALATLAAALARAHKAEQVASDGVPWKALLDAEVARMDAALAKARKTNQVVYFQKEAKHPAPCPQPKQLVTPIQFTFDQTGPLGQ